MFRRVCSSIRIELIKKEQDRVQLLLLNKPNERDKYFLENYLNILEQELKIYPELQINKKNDK
jgi:hypothetical protein